LICPIIVVFRCCLYSLCYSLCMGGR